MARILIVDDDFPLADMIRDWLEGEDYIAEVSTTGNDTLERLQKFEYDLIILDWTLPDISGLVVLEKMRKDGLNTPVIMLTGKDHVSDKEKGLDTGADDYLTKPFHMKEVSSRIKALLRRLPRSKRIVSDGKE